MRRNILTLATAAVFALFLTAGDASACLKLKKCGKPACAPAPVCEPVPVCEPAPIPCAAPVKKCHFSLPKLPKLNCHFKLPKISLCHKTAPVCETTPACGPAPCDTPIYATGQSYPTPAPQSYAAPQILSSGQ